MNTEKKTDLSGVPSIFLRQLNNMLIQGPAACGRSRWGDGLGNKHNEIMMASQMIGTTETDWFNPGVNPPPFDMKLMLMVAGSRSEDCGRTFEPYTVVMTAYVQQQGPGDEYDDEPVFDEYMAGDQTDFLDFQFDLKDEYGEVLDWYSDSIVAWAYYPLGIAQTAVSVERFVRRGTM